MLTATQRVIALAFVLAATTATNSLAQEAAPDPDAPETMGAGTMPEQGPGSALQQAQDAPTDQPETTGDLMGQGTMGEGMMNHGTMGGPIEQGMTSPGMMGEGMMCSEMCAGMSGQGRAGGMMQPGMMGEGRTEESKPDSTMGSMTGTGMHEHAMRIGFALADASGDGGLSLDEIADMQARIFQAVDADDNGNVTPEELQGFMRQ